MRRAKIAKLVLSIVCSVTIVALMVLSCRESQEAARWKTKASKFDDYCRRVRASLETVQLSLEPPAQKASSHVHRFRQYLANTFYSRLPQIDEDAVQRCAEPTVTSKTVNGIRDRCRLPPKCDLVESDDPNCQVDPGCLEHVVRELLALMPRS